MSPQRRKAAAGRCPICGRPRVEAFKPFCSKHCADVDLARWLQGRYVIAGPENDETEAESPAKVPDSDE
jgi:endogenous inhibitor of DNA gyrase (YacG/DUF329 family)